MIGLHELVKLYDWVKLGIAGVHLPQLVKRKIFLRTIYSYYTF